MNLHLRLYKNVKVNEGDNTHLIFSRGNSAALFTALGSANLSVYTYMDNYRLYDGTLILAESYVTSLKDDFYKITYAVEEDIDSGYIRGYHVRSARIIPAGIAFEVERDLWLEGTIDGAIKLPHVIRSNRDFAGVGIYDDVPLTKGAQSVLSIAQNEFENISNYAVAFVLSYNTYEGTNVTLTKTEIAYIPLNVIYDKVHALNAGADSFNILIKAAEVTAGIHSVKGYWGGVFGVELQAKVTRAWIVPTSSLRASGHTQTIYTRSGIFGDNADHPIDDVNFAMPSIKNETLELWRAASLPSLYPQNDLLVGVPYLGRRVTRFVDLIDGNRVYIRYTWRFSDLSVEVIEGNEATDITTGFELPLTDNNEIATATRQISQFFNGLVRTAGAAVAGGIKGGVGGAIAQGGIAALSSLPEIGGAPAQAFGKGDAFITYCLPTASQNPYTTQLRAPNSVTLAHSRRNEKAHAYYVGAKYDLYFENISDVNSNAFPQLGQQPPTFAARDDIYLQLDSAVYEGMQDEARAFVDNELRRGAYLKFL